MGAPSLRPLLAAMGAAGLAWLAAACDGARDAGDPVPPDARPSFLLIVVDTLRADAVSAYGRVADTTPRIDALAAVGLRYERALAPSPWTLPSHATLFTGLGPERHGVGVAGRMALPEDLETLAGRLGEAGWETIGFSENPIVGAAVGLARGFSHFEGEADAVRARGAGAPASRFDVVEGLAAWAASRAAERPFFAFVNLFDPHDPYEPREDGAFLPEGVSVERARRVGSGAPGQGVAEFAGICDRLPPPDELAILRGLYLGEVARADAKVGAIHARAAAAAPGPLVTVVTSDHGEHLGEHRLLGHEFSVRGEVLHVPLVVHGLEAPPARIAAPVALADVPASVLAWAGLSVPADWRGRTLPREAATAGGGPPRDLVAFYDDHPLRAPEGFRAAHEADRRRRGCGPEDRVFGDLLALVRAPWKLAWYERHAPELFDLRWDAAERSDVAAHHRERAERMLAALDGVRAQLRARAREGPGEPVSPETLRALEALGYVE